MNTRKLLVAAALLAVSTSSQAWGPFWGNDGWGNGNGVMDGNFGFSMNASARGHGNGFNNYGYAPYGYAPYGYYPGAMPGYAPYGMPQERAESSAAARRDALEAQRKTAMEFQQRMEEQRQAIVKAQRESFERQLAMSRGRPAEETNSNN